MQSQNPFMDEVAKFANAAAGMAQAATEEAKAGFRAQVERLVVDLDLIRRDEFEALKAQVAALSAELAALKPTDAP